MFNPNIDHKYSKLHSSVFKVPVYYDADREKIALLVLITFGDTLPGSDSEQLFNKLSSVKDGEVADCTLSLVRRTAERDSTIVHVYTTDLDASDEELMTMLVNELDCVWDGRKLIRIAPLIEAWLPNHTLSNSRFHIPGDAPDVNILYVVEKPLPDVVLEEADSVVHSDVQNKEGVLRRLFGAHGVKVFATDVDGGRINLVNIAKSLREFKG